MSKYSLVWGVGAGGVVLSACGVLHQVPTDPPPPLAIPKMFSATATAGASTTVVAHQPDWWRSFNEPELNRLVALALEGSMSLKAAYARLEAASAAARIAGSEYVPVLTVGPQISYGQQVVNFGGGANVFEQSQLNLQGSFSYELDLWGRIHGQVQAGGADAQGSEFDLATAHITVASNIADTWLRAIEQKAVIELLRSQLDANNTYLSLVELRFRQGLVSSLDVLQQRQQSATLEAQIPPAQAQLAVFEHQLAAWMGKPPGSLHIEQATLPKMPAVPHLGVPSEVLLHRPDVRAAQMRVVAADHRVGSAVAARFPRLTLSFTGGLRGFDLASGLFQNYLYNLVSGITLPLTDQVRLGAQEKQARAQLKEVVANYGDVVLTALREVEDALVQEARQQDLLKELGRQVELAQATLTEAQRRYKNGLSDYLPVLTAVQTLQSVEQRQLTARRQWLSFRVQLYRALGGIWTRETLAQQSTEVEDAS